MTCECCKKNFDTRDIEPEFGGNSGESIEVNFLCPHCGQGYYTYVELPDCERDPMKCGTTGEQR